ncbi:hypothetical protein QBC33DRAFT_561881 [Phialemonium atrogriseum]|uniref:Uncharacterized protein n=1 Tax=Phialemonium atrogriseum TaxID=1093897 RepID=A0AAJ0FKW2_9PEZI|nr:uncharacterized protein QBC33DRAFT_561881 [Phialemonium atrogriseum]KAK1764490.1 hypothetical protein QBC33DRAFT_561881 [Phialemonium atrogriseum]
MQPAASLKAAIATALVFSSSFASAAVVSPESNSAPSIATRQFDVSQIQALAASISQAQWEILSVADRVKYDSQSVLSTWNSGLSVVLSEFLGQLDGNVAVLVASMSGIAGALQVAAGAADVFQNEEGAGADAWA